MAQRRIGVEEFKACPGEWVAEAQNGVTVDLMDGGRRIASVVPISETMREDEPRVRRGRRQNDSGRDRAQALADLKEGRLSVQWWIRRRDFLANPDVCMTRLRDEAHMIVVTEDENVDRQVARVVPEGRKADCRKEFAYRWSGRMPQPYMPTVRLRGPETSLDFIRWARGYPMPNYSSRTQEGGRRGSEKEIEPRLTEGEMAAANFRPSE